MALAVPQCFAEDDVMAPSMQLPLLPAVAVLTTLLVNRPLQQLAAVDFTDSSVQLPLLLAAAVSTTPLVNGPLQQLVADDSTLTCTDSLSDFGALGVPRDVVSNALLQPFPSSVACGKEVWSEVP